MKPPQPHKAEIIAALTKSGETCSAIARRFGVTKSVVIGIKMRAGLCELAGRPVARETSMQRLDRLHARMDAVLAETQPILDRVRAAWRAVEQARKKAEPGERRFAA